MIYLSNKRIKQLKTSKKKKRIKIILRYNKEEPRTNFLNLMLEILNLSYST